MELTTREHGIITRVADTPIMDIYRCQTGDRDITTREHEREITEERGREQGFSDRHGDSLVMRAKGRGG